MFTNNTQTRLFGKHAMHDVAVIGAGIAGMATAARLQAAGLRTVVLEAHGLAGGCAGYFRTGGFAFDVGATTLVDFGPGGVGGELYEAIGMTPPPVDVLEGYTCWLPDRQVVLHRDEALFRRERAACFGDDGAHRRFWRRFDRIAAAFWQASRRGITLPIRSVADAARNAGALGAVNLPLVRYLRWTVGDLMRDCGVRGDRALAGLLGMLIEDTVHSRLDEAPLINGVLGATIRATGLARPRGGMSGFWTAFVAHYRALGGELRLATRATAIAGHEGDFSISTARGVVRARQVVSAVPASLSAQLGPPALGAALRPYLTRDALRLGGALVVFLGVPNDEVSGQGTSHHQLLNDYDSPLGDGNNMFISVSAEGDLQSAPRGRRAVMISTHCELAPWEQLDAGAYARKKSEAGDRLLALARRVYPRLGERATVLRVATPRTYERYTSRPRGAVGGVRATLQNSNQHAIPHDVGVRGLWLCGDTTWPGLGTVACVVGSRSVARGVFAAGTRERRAAPLHEPRPAVLAPRRSDAV